LAIFCSHSWADIVWWCSELCGVMLKCCVGSC
jgi:hypothetical protein